MPRKRIKTKTESANFGLQGAVNNSREHVKLGKPVDVGPAGECLGFESRPNYEARHSSEKEEFGYNSMFEVGSSSKDCGSHGLDTDGFKLKDSGHPVKGLMDMEKNSLELLGTDAPALKSTALELRSTASSWVVADKVCRSSRLGLIDVPLKVRLFPIPSPIFSCFQLERAGIAAWLLGLAGGVVIGVGARIEIGRVMGLVGEVVCGGWNIGVGLGFDDGGCRGDVTRIWVEGQCLERGGSSLQLSQREDAWAIVDQSDEEILEVTLLCMVSGLLEEGKTKAVDPSKWVMDRMKNLANL